MHNDCSHDRSRAKFIHIVGPCLIDFDLFMQLLYLATTPSRPATTKVAKPREGESFNDLILVSF